MPLDVGWAGTCTSLSLVTLPVALPYKCKVAPCGKDWKVVSASWSVGWAPHIFHLTTPQPCQVIASHFRDLCGTRPSRCPFRMSLPIILFDRCIARWPPHKAHLTHSRTGRYMHTTFEAYCKPVRSHRVQLQAEGCLTAPADASSAAPTGSNDAAAGAEGQRKAVAIGVGLEAAYESSQLASPSGSMVIVDALLR